MNNPINLPEAAPRSANTTVVALPDESIPESLMKHVVVEIAPSNGKTEFREAA
jgi:hypothetical protein